jgi:predicted kinase
VTELVVLVGLQASGKSTFAASRFAGTHTMVSKDQMRSARHKEARQRREVAAALSAGRDVVVDNTNPGPEQWTPLIELAREHGARPVAYYFPPHPSACLARNAARTGPARVPKVGVLATLKALRRPSRAAGFDAVYVVELAGAGRFTVVEDGDALPGGGPPIRPISR